MYYGLCVMASVPTLDCRLLSPESLILTIPVSAVFFFLGGYSVLGLTPRVICTSKRQRAEPLQSVYAIKWASWWPPKKIYGIYE